ncbi:MAG: tRNA (adenosine(37)-N6)-threonylcarbamoyltransferase complex ATPase subunit type 1 TsaE [Clostridia bacterium]|nr:tRNA (adenosine(37)-N6)-threonylcarbamoyltransferase complex ATPase subunit type 1 TsaE [Clostridia bacterium]
MVCVHCRNEQETERVGALLGRQLACSDVLLLSGEMGTGKSVLTRGLAAQLGIEGPVPSPTFTILLIHEGSGLTLYHFDLYRLENEDELYEMGLDEMIPPDNGVAVIEWPQNCASAMPVTCFRVELAYVPDAPEERMLNIKMPSAEKEQRFREDIEASGITAN